MKTLKITLVLLSLIGGLNLNAQSETTRKEGELTWYTNMLQANDISKASNKPLFAFFTGSDWCGWCKKLQRDVFAKPEFIAWAKKNVVLVELDFPRGKALSPELTQQNSSLQQTFGVQGFPTIWMFFLHKKDAGFDIEALGSTGYPQGAEPGKEEVKFLKDANAILAKRTVK
jgi:thioredoxin-related protein